MEEIIKQILNETGYVEKTEGISFHTKDEKSFFFVTSIPEADFMTLKNKDLIKKNADYRHIMDGFLEIINKGENTIIEKNSSLIILVNCSKINAVGDLQQQILLFEEDQYFFKKYVILYTNDSIINLTSIPLIPELRNKVNDKANFSYFSEQGYKEDIAEYLVILQLFIKLPFLSLDLGNQEFTSLNQKINSVLDIEKTLYESLLSHAEELGQLDFSNPAEEDKINELLTILPYD